MKYEYAIVVDKNGQIYKKHHSLEYLKSHLQDMLDDGESVEAYRLYKRPVAVWEEIKDE